MSGSRSAPGVNPRAVAALFNQARARSATYDYKFFVSMFEIYNDHIRDLLCKDDEARGDAPPKLSDVRWDDSRSLDVKLKPDGSCAVDGLVEVGRCF